jgi:DNA-binding HxlR family transcriptional regulator
MPKDNSIMSGRKEPKENNPTSVAMMVEDIVGCKWSMRLLELVAEGCSRPGILLRTCLGLSAKVMNERLRKMVRFGIMQRNVIGEKPPLEVQYKLTPFGNRFKKLIGEVRHLQEAVDKGGIYERPGI